MPVRESRHFLFESVLAPSDYVNRWCYGYLIVILLFKESFCLAHLTISSDIAASFSALPQPIGALPHFATYGAF